MRDVNTPHSIKREIGHLCHDERRPSAKDKDKASSSSGPTSNVQTSQPPQPAQPVDVTKSLTGKQLLEHLFTSAGYLDLSFVLC